MVVYTHRVIPSLRKELSRAAPNAQVIVTEADLPQLLEAAPHVRTVAEHVGRVGNIARGRVLLIEVGK